ncbi:cupin domain-containing protein [Rhodopila sp.]|uniref:cupin domain-containing protein n=1 Tax=Rhodopila sp. TaxID=2480087 RepID=UPI002C6359DD|nr:cupin domain-containing protein [Rhodopila sp.]HVZ10379.1 cupin domain-containing protein [Rhodopila sp.]
MPSVVRFKDLEPSWNTRQAREAGYMRWLVTWVGGPAGYINTNPNDAIRSSHCAVGLMYLPRGQRQAGRHTHGVTEVYVVLQGQVEGFDASGHPHHAGPMDCIYIPAGCPHGVRNSGLDDVVLIWVHDGIERHDAAIYYPDNHQFGHVPSIQVVRFADLEAAYPEPDSRTPGTMRWSVNWVSGLAGSVACNRASAARNEKISIGMTVLEPGNAIPASSYPVTRLYLVVEGRAVTRPAAANIVLDHLDGLHVPAGETVVLRNNGPGPLRLLWVDSQPAAEPAAPR